MNALSEGQDAPNITLMEDAAAPGTTTDLASLQGKPVVLYFYPKDDTEGCTAEAKDFSELLDAFAKSHVHVIGISPDSLKRHANFRKKHGLKVRLASDPDTTVAKAYGVWVEKQMFGRKYMGVERATFLISKTGRIARIWRNVKVAGHAAEVLAAVKKL